MYVVKLDLQNFVTKFLFLLVLDYLLWCFTKTKIIQLAKLMTLF